jgi:hypothetical protein
MARLQNERFGLMVGESAELKLQYELEKLRLDQAEKLYNLKKSEQLTPAQREQEVFELQPRFDV